MYTIRRISNYNPVLANTDKNSKITAVFDQYKVELQQLVSQLLYSQTQVPKFFNKDITDQIKLPARLSQVVAKQASGMVRSVHEKIKLAEKAGNKQKYQEEILAKWQSKTLNININSVNIELDSRFIDIQKAENTSICDYWIKITSFPTKSFFVPMKMTNHMKDLQKRGFSLKTNSLRINSDGSLGFYFLKEVPNQKSNLHALGVDLGRNKIVSCSDNQTETTHSCGYRISDLLSILKRRQHGSKNASKTRTNIKNQINYSVKHDIDWENIDHLVIENLIGIKNGNKWGNKNQNWRVSYATNKIMQLSEEHGVRLSRINPAYTSQTCSACGVVDKKSRRNEKFCCTNCDYEIDADINAAINIRNKGIYSSPALKTPTYNIK